MNIYTFYETVKKWDYDKHLLDLWIENWKNHGFNPIVLSLEDSKQNSDYENFVRDISETYEYMINKPMIRESSPWSYYILYCFVRFLAYSEVKTNDKILIMDYDIYNINFNAGTLDDSDNLLFLHENCPCIVYGTPNHFKTLYKNIQETCKKYPQLLLDEYKKSPYVDFHDMTFLHLCRMSENKDLQEIIKISKMKFTQHQNSPLKDTLFHASNDLVAEYEKNNNITTGDIPHIQKINIRLEEAKKRIQRLTTD